MPSSVLARPKALLSLLKLITLHMAPITKQVIKSDDF